MKTTQAIQGFLLTISGNGYSEETVKNYSRQLNKFSVFLIDKELSLVSTNDIREFFSYLRKTPIVSPSGIERKAKESTIHAYWKAIRSFYKWAEIELKTERPDKAIPMPRVAKPDVLPFSYNEIRALIKACEFTRDAETMKRRSFSMKRPTYLRDKFLVLLLLDTGIRVGECSRLRIRDVNLSTNEISILPVGSGIKSKSRHVYIGKNCKSVAWRYLASREDSNPEEPLFLSENNLPMNRDSIKSILARLGERAQVINVHPHRFRHTFACEYLRNGGDVFTLQRALGHNSLEMVRYYLSIVDSDSKEAHRKSSPVDHWHL